MNFRKDFNSTNVIILLIGILSLAHAAFGQTINRKELVSRHNILNTSYDSLGSISVGNGNFAYTVDITGMQSFPEYYVRGVPLGCQSAWAWHSSPNSENFRIEETLKEYDLDGRKISYSVQLKEPERNRRAVEYFRSNPHRLQLGNIGLEIAKSDGSIAKISDIENIKQRLDLWTGIITSEFAVENNLVKVFTLCLPNQDALAFKIESNLLLQEKIKIRVQVPDPSFQWKDVGDNFEVNPILITTHIENKHSKSIQCRIDSASYFIHFNAGMKANIINKARNYFIISPTKANVFEFGVLFSPKADIPVFTSFSKSKMITASSYSKFWMSGGAIDLKGSTDTRAHELERRIILSQYLTKIQCSSSFPPQETGLTFNSWYGKPHLEMHWWHAVHFALWGRTNYLEASLDWYFKAKLKARLTAKRQGMNGVRWQKMTDHEGNDSPSSVGSFLIWQQPHVIYMSELVYRSKPQFNTLNKYKDLIFETADFMASYPRYDSITNKYNLGKGLIPAQESFDPMTTYNPTYELTYWRWALEMAQTWRLRLNLSRNPQWDKVLNNLASLPIKDSLYLAAENAPDSYTNSKYMHDHPAVLAAYSSLPLTKNLDTAIMMNTFNKIWFNWDWPSTWGWDFPLMAMTATRLNMPEKALDALLMSTQKNTYLSNGHNYQDSRLTIYLPGNGGLLSAVAMMCAGTDTNHSKNPGFPKNSLWKIKWEGLKKIF